MDPAKISPEVEALSCWTVNVCPPMSIVPVRAAPPFAEIAKVSVPLPEPDAPLVMLIQGALLEATQAEPGAAFT
jgi:hypothetical protein